MVQFALTGFADKMSEILPVIIKEFSRRQAIELYSGRITLPQFLILDFLNRQRESKMTDLAKFMGVSTAAMTGVVDRLVRNRYVQRKYELDDRRVIKIKLSSKGSELIKKIYRQRRKMIISIFGKISRPEREDYLRILMHIRDILTRQKMGN